MQPISIQVYGEGAREQIEKEARMMSVFAGDVTVSFMGYAFMCVISAGWRHRRPHVIGSIVAQKGEKVYTVLGGIYACTLASVKAFDKVVLRKERDCKDCEQIFQSLGITEPTVLFDSTERPSSGGALWKRW